MTITPQELLAIKQAVATVCTGPIPMHADRATLALEAIDAALGGIPSPLLVFDPQTGEQVRPYPPMFIEAGYEIASTVLPGMPAKEVERVYSAWCNADPEPEPWAVGSTVSHRELATMQGKIEKRVESDEGELHTVSVRWSSGTVTLHSPRELVEVR